MSFGTNDSKLNYLLMIYWYQIYPTEIHVLLFEESHFIFHINGFKNRRKDMIPSGIAVFVSLLQGRVTSRTGSCFAARGIV